MSHSIIGIQDMGLVCALGRHRDEVLEGLFRSDRPGGVAPTEAYSPGRELHLGIAPGSWPPPVDAPVHLRSRNNALLDAALKPILPTLQALLRRHGPARVGVIIGSSTSGIAEGEAAMATHTRTGAFPDEFHYGQQDLASASRFVAWRSGAAGPALTLSTACSSSAKALASAARWLRAGICDAVVAGGADSLCAFTVAGFSALESVSAARCNPASRNRQGINIGEGAALFVLSRDPAEIRLAGWGESSDAHHISAPEPEGRGAEAAMRLALQRGGIHATQVDYVNLHGTATPQNDLSESRAVARVFGGQTWCSSTKALTGHALGAAGAIEAALCWLALSDADRGQRLPPHWWDGCIDPQLPPLRWATPGARMDRPMRYALSNSLAFGGNNASLLLARD